MNHASTEPEFWNTRYDSGRTPWDFGGVPLPLQRFLATHPGGGRGVLIPGCGSGYEVLAFADAGYAVTAIDFSAIAVVRARAQLSPLLAGCVIEGDFFTHPFDRAPFDLVYERTFLCALPPERWPEIARRLATLVQPGGSLVGLYFFGEKEEGPPFGLEDGEPARLFDPWFELARDEAVPAAESLPLFAHRERWQERRRRNPPAA